MDFNQSCLNLQLTSPFSLVELKKQYRIMAKKYHPDVYKGSDKDKFTSINQSYNFLIDLVK